MSRFSIPLMIAALAAGCFGGESLPDAKDARAAQGKLAKLRSDHDQLGGQLSTLQTTGVAVCAFAGTQVEFLRAACPRLQPLLTLADQLYAQSSKALFAAEAGLVSYEAAAKAVEMTRGTITAVRMLFEGVPDADRREGEGSAPVVDSNPAADAGGPAGDGQAGQAGVGASEAGQAAP